MKWYHKTFLFFQRNWWFISLLVLLVITFGLFTWFQAVPTLADPDSFYHIKMAQLIPKEGIMKTLPWLQYTILRNVFIDQHFLYHVFLIPFVYSLDPIQGAKLATVMLCSALIITFYLFLRSERVKFAFIYSLILLASTPFIFRINLIKAPVLSIILLLLGLLFLFKKRPVALFVLSFIYVWAYGGFILILVFSGVYALVGVCFDVIWHRRYRKFWLVVKGNEELRLFLAAVAGVIAGLVINFQFPQNLVFYWHQLVEIGIVNYQKVISVGNEWYPYPLKDLFGGTALICVLLLISMYSFVVRPLRPSKKLITTLIIFLFFLAFTLKSKRYIEYYVPFAIIFCAFSLNHYLQAIDWQRLWRTCYTWYLRHRIAATILLIYFVVTVPTLIIKDERATYHDLKGGISINRFSRVSAWLVQNSKPGDIVFHSSWDEFPMLFYFNSKDYYIFGLDPTFSYEYSHELHKKIVDLTIGTQTNDVYQDIKYTFKSSFVFVEKNHSAMNNNIKNSSGFKEVYADEEATVYQVL
jgi:hypothetical protein